MTARRADQQERGDTVALSDGAITHRVLGPVGGRPVVFVHGALVDSSLWQDVDRRLAEKGLRTYAPDLPMGSHRLPLPEADLSPMGQARRVLDYVDHHDLDDVTLVANDSGGAVSQLLLASGDERVERIGRVVFTNCDTVGRFPPPPFDRMMRQATHTWFFGVALQAMRVPRLRNRIGFGPLCAQPLDPALTWRWAAPATTDGRIRRDFARFGAGIDQRQLEVATDRLGDFDRPVLVVWGVDDPFFRLADGRALAARFGDARVVEVTGCRAFVAHDQPQRLADEILTFVGAPVA